MYLPEPTNDEDIAELTAAARTATATGRPPAPNPASVPQEQVYEVTSEVRRILRGKLSATPEHRRQMRAALEPELRRIGVIGYGVRVRKGGDLDELLDALVEWVLAPASGEAR